MANPFEDADRDYLVVRNDEDQHSLWPAELEVPAGWLTVSGPGPRGDCLAYVEAHWQDMRPASLRASMSAKAASAD